MKTTNYKPGHVYLVNFGIAYKLGISTDHKTFRYRMTEYRMVWRNAFEKLGYSAPELIHMFPVDNMREAEKAIQRRWSTYRYKSFTGTEFYTLPPDEIDWFCS